MSNKKKILIYSPYSLQVGGGIETWIFYLVEYFSKYVKDVELIIATNEEHNKKNIRLSKEEVRKKLGKVKWVELPTFRYLSGMRINLLNLKGIKKLRDLIKNSSIIYCVFSPPHDILFYLSKLGLNKNIIYGFHGEFFLKKEETKNIYDLSINEKLHPFISPLINMYRKISLFFLKRENKKLHVVNKNLESFFKSKGLNAKYIPNPIDTNKFKLSFNKKKFIVLYTGRSEFIKGALVLKEAIEKFNRKYKDDLKFIITGGGTYSKEFKKLSNKYNLIDYLGFVNFSKLQELYKEASLYISPSYRDPFPFTLLEAQSAGLHVVTTRTSGGEIACPIGKIIVPLGDSEALADAIHRKYLEWKKDKKSYYKKSKEIRNFVKRNFSFNKVLKEICNYLLNTSS